MSWFKQKMRIIWGSDEGNPAGIEETTAQLTWSTRCRREGWTEVSGILGKSVLPLDFKKIKCRSNCLLCRSWAGSSLLNFLTVLIPVFYFGNVRMIMVLTWQMRTKWEGACKTLCTHLARLTKHSVSVSSRCYLKGGDGSRRLKTGQTGLCSAPGHVTDSFLLSTLFCLPRNPFLPLAST